MMPHTRGMATAAVGPAQVYASYLASSFSPDPAGKWCAEQVLAIGMAIDAAGPRAIPPRTVPPAPDTPEPASDDD